MALMIVYPLQYVLRVDVLAHDSEPVEVAAFLNKTIEKGAVVETWERELTIISPQNYHFPQQQQLISTASVTLRGMPRAVSLGGDYFRHVEARYLVNGFFGRWTQLYDEVYLSQHACKLAVFGEGVQRYEVYRFPPPMTGGNGIAPDCRRLP